MQEWSQRSALPNSSSSQLERKCRPRACLFDNKTVRFVYDYLTYRKQRTKISDAYSLLQEI